MIPGTIKITRADASHATALTALSVRTFRDTFEASNKREDMDKYIAGEMNVAKLTGELNDEQNIFLLAWNNDAMAGYAKLRANKMPEELINSNAIELERLYVQKELHGKKVGAALMGHCLQYATHNGYDAMWLGVWEHNYVATRFYEQWGFELFGAHPFILGDDVQTDVLMKKELQHL